MIPLRLRLKNFLGYRESHELSLEGIRLACLSGDNGAGKSSLLDAMTWALWGRARGRDRGRTDADGLIHTGQSEMEVELEFGLGRETTEGETTRRYRALRKHKKGNPGRPSQTILELQVAAMSESLRTWQPVASGRDAQSKIEELLRLDYDTFINSAFLLQGRADEFTVKKPTERKQLLAEILGLSFYDELEKRAREKRREEENQIRVLDSEIENIVKELALKSGYEAELRQAQENLAGLEPRVRSQEAILAGLRQKQGELQAKKAEAEQVGRALEPVRKEVGSLQARQQEHQCRIEEYEALLNQRANIEGGYNQLQQARKDINLWNDKLQTLNVLQQQQNRLEHLVKDARATLERDLALLKRELAQLEARSQALPQLRQSLSALQARLTELLTEETSLAKKRQEAQQVRDKAEALQTTCARMETELKQVSKLMAETAKGLASAESQRDGHKRRIEGYEAILAQREEIHAGYVTLQQAKKGAEVWNEKLAGVNALQLEQNRLEHIIKDARAVLEQEQAVVKRQISDLEARCSALPQLSESLAETQSSLKLLETRESALKESRERAQELRDTINGLQAANDQIGKEISASMEKLSLLVEGDAHCPLCETDLGIEGKGLLEAKYRDEIGAKTQARARGQDTLKDTQTKYLSLANEMKHEEGRIGREMARAHTQLAALEKDLDYARQAQASLAIEREKFLAVQTRLVGREYARAEYERLGKLTAEIAETGYDYAQHQKIKSRLLDFEPYEARKQRLDETEIRIQAECQSLSQVVDSIIEIEGRSRDLAHKQEELKGQLDSSSKHLSALREDYLSVVQEIDGAEKRWNSEKSRAITELAVVENNVKQAEQAQIALPAERDKLAEIERRLTQNEYAEPQQRELGDVMAKINALGYDIIRHQAVRKELLNLESFEARKHQLDEAEVRIQAERSALTATVEALAQAEGRVDELGTRMEALSIELAALPDVVSKLRLTEESYRALLSEERAYRDRLATAHSSLERCQALEQTKTEKEAARVGAAQQESIYRDLTEAFGKRGVPALLIEAALPELEAEANRLLSRMTENRLSIKLESQRELKSGKGEPVETLDIKTSDELGTRDYEMFSGGEAFRINFALRIALSRLLARRAGAPLPTLVIDEGFGTQDGSGRDKLVEVINSIQDDFEKVLVITHIEELKDLFPVRIEVTKTSEGSTFRVVE